MRSCAILPACLLATLVSIGCSGGASSSDGNASGGTAGGGSTSEGNGGATSEGNGSSTGEGTPAPLSPLEEALVGVWRGAASGSRVHYYVLVGDRTGCLWERDGDNFGQRFSEVQFSDWHLGEDSLDEKGRMTLSFTNKSDGAPQAIDRYDPKTDHVFFAGITSLTWQSILIDCAAKGTNATQTDVKRGGQLSK